MANDLPANTPLLYKPTNPEPTLQLPPLFNSHTKSELFPALSLPRTKQWVTKDDPFKSQCKLFQLFGAQLALLVDLQLPSHLPPHGKCIKALDHAFSVLLLPPDPMLPPCGRAWYGKPPSLENRDKNLSMALGFLCCYTAISIN